MNKMFMSLLAATVLLAPACGTSKKEAAPTPGQTAPATTETKLMKLEDKVKADATYKAVPAKNFDKNNAINSVTLLDADKEFIHATKGAKVEKVLKKNFKGQKEIVLLQLDEKVLTANGFTIKMEKKKPTSKSEYPHLYGKKEIPAAAVIEVITVEEQPDGSWMTK